MDRSPFLIPSFVIGVTGHTDPQSEFLDEVRKTIGLLFEFLERGAQAEEGALFERIKAKLPHREHAPGLNQWPGLGRTPMMVLTSLAPGADSIVAEAALEKNMEVRAPLPFPKGVYRDLSTFVKDATKPTEEEKEALDRYERLLDRIGDENVFPVRLAGEIGWDEKELAAQMAADALDPSARHRRYQAAGEYVAAHCDLLLALWDDDYDSGKAEGAAGIVQVKLRGVTPDLLPAGNSFTWANCGSVIHVHMPRRKNPDPVNKEKVGRVRWLHRAPLPKELVAKPDEAAPAAFLQDLAGTWEIRRAFRGLKGGRWRAYQRWQTAGNHHLCRIARSLACFNEEYRRADQTIRPLFQMLDPNLYPDLKDYPLSPPAGTVAHELESRAPEFFNTLAPLVAARRYAADTSGIDLRRRSQRALFGIFLLVFGFAVCVQVFSDWEVKGVRIPESGKSGELAQGRERPGEEVSKRGSGGHRTGEDFYIRFWIGFGGLALGALSLGLFWWHRRSEVEERDQDYRSLAEGLRVQIAWCMAGLYRSVAAHYLERQRNEMDWIRGALSSLAMPYHRWSRWFDAMDKGFQLLLLRWVHTSWVSSQAGFYRKRAKEHAHNRHAIHKVSGVLALCGVCLVSALVLEAGSPFLKTRWFERTIHEAVPWGEAAGLALISFFLILWVWKIMGAVRKKTSWKDAPAKALAEALRAFIDGFVPTWPSTVYQAPGARHLRMIVSFVAHLPLAALLGAAMVALLAAGHEAMGFREAEAPISIFSGVFLLTGALLVGWTEKNLLSEQAYQYNAMESLFSAAQRRSEEWLGEAKEAQARVELLFSAAQTRSVERLSEADAAQARKDIETRDRLIRQTREMFYDLGIEALDENAEWLILHRARPMEPMMTG